MTTGERLRDIRNKQRLSRRELSACSGVAEDSIKQYESGRRKPRIEQVRLLSAALGVSPAYLLGFENENGSEHDLGLGEIEIRKLGYSESAAEALANAIAYESWEYNTTQSLPMGKAIQLRRKALGISIQKLAELTGIAIEDIQDLENKANRAKYDDLLLIAKALQTSPDYLLGRTAEAEKDLAILTPMHVDTGSTYAISTSSINETLSEMAEDELIKEERRVCGYNEKMRDSDLQRVWNPERIGVVTEFIKRNSEMLKAQMGMLKNEQKE